MNTLDILLLIPIAFGAFNGYRKGLLIEIFGIVAFVMAIILGFKFLNLGSSLLESLMGKETLHWISPYLSFFIVFLPSLFLLSKIGFLMKKAIRLTFLGVLDGIFGATLGAVTATFGVSILIWIIGKFGIKLPEELLAESKIFEFVRDFAPKVIRIISDLLPGGNWLEYLESIRDKLKK